MHMRICTCAHQKYMYIVLGDITDQNFSLWLVAETPQLTDFQPPENHTSVTWPTGVTRCNRITHIDLATWCVTPPSSACMHSTPGIPNKEAVKSVHD